MSVVSPQKTLIWTSICAPEAPSLLISSGHNPRLGGGTSSQLGGHGPGMPPGGAGSGWTALFRAFNSHQQPSAYLTKGIPQLDKPLGQTGQTLRAYTVAEGFQQINNFSLEILF